MRDHYGDIAFIDHDALRRGDVEDAVGAVPSGLGPVWYRGWMLSADEYAAMAATLKQRGTVLLTHPDDYRRAHELPGWHETFAGLTPHSVWRPLGTGQDPGDLSELAELVRPLRSMPAVVKDYVKSCKHEWEEACFVPDVKNLAQLHDIASKMVALRDDHLAGGLVVREFEEYDGDGEARVWWVDGEPALVGPHRTAPVWNPIRTWTRWPRPSAPWAAGSSRPIWPAARTAPGVSWRSATARSAICRRPWTRWTSTRTCPSRTDSLLQGRGDVESRDDGLPHTFSPVRRPRGLLDGAAAQIGHDVILGHAFGVALAELLVHPIPENCEPHVLHAIRRRVPPRTV